MAKENISISEQDLEFEYTFKSISKLLPSKEREHAVSPLGF